MAPKEDIYQTLSERYSKLIVLTDSFTDEQMRLAFHNQLVQLSFILKTPEPIQLETLEKALLIAHRSVTVENKTYE